MIVLFVSSGNSRNGINQIVKNQGESLKKEGVYLRYFTIKGKGIWGYLKHINKLRKYIVKENTDIIHAHYSFSGFISKLATRKPVVVSLMGNDVNVKQPYKIFLKFFINHFWNSVIVKTEEMKSKLKSEKVHIIPNGVNIEHFKPLPKAKATKQVEFDPTQKNILFMSYSHKGDIRPEKNYALAREAIQKIQDYKVELKLLTFADFKTMPYYYNAADVLLLTSTREGSPNVIKEAMACNLPIVATDVGDIREITENTEGCFVTNFNPDEIASKIKYIFDNNIESKGRKRIIELGLNTENISKKIMEVYSDMLNRN